MKQKYLLILIACAALGGLGLSIKNSFCDNHYHIASVKVKKIFEGFSYKKELEKKLDASKFQRQKILDSLSFELNRMLNQYATQKEETMKELITVRREEFLSRRQQFTSDNESETQQYDKLIWTQIRQYTKEYSIEKGYDWILSDDEQLQLLYAGEKYDVTTELLEYINSKYK